MEILSGVLRLETLGDGARFPQGRGGVKERKGIGTGQRGKNSTPRRGDAETQGGSAEPPGERKGSQPRRAGSLGVNGRGDWI